MPALAIDGPAALEVLKRDWNSPKKLGASLDAWSKQQHPAMEVALATIAGSGQVRRRGRARMGGRLAVAMQNSQAGHGERDFGVPAEGRRGPASAPPPHTARH